MVDATVDNKPVSIQLAPGQSTTVPSNETWKVQLTLSVQDPNTATPGGLNINGTTAIGALNSANSQGQIAPDTVLVGNDTVSMNGGVGASITGFVVSS